MKRCCPSAIGAVESAIGQRVLYGFLLVLQRTDAFWQLLQFTLILVAQLLLCHGLCRVDRGQGFGGLVCCGYRWNVCSRCQGCSGQFAAAARLHQPVLHAAFVLAPQAIAFKGNRAGDDVVEKGAVVADQEHSTFIGL